MTVSQLQFFSDDGYEEAIQTLEHSSDHRILRRVDFPAHAIVVTDLPDHERCTIRNGIFLDTETTGMDHDADEVIQLCMMPFRFAVDGETKEAYLIEVQKPYVGLREPGKPVPEEVVQLTGITNEMLKGQSLDLEAIEEFIAGAG